MARLRRVADELGLPWRERDRTYNSRLAQEMSKWAEDKGSGEEFHMSVFRAYFAEGKEYCRTRDTDWGSRIHRPSGRRGAADPAVQEVQGGC